MFLWLEIIQIWDWKEINHSGVILKICLKAVLWTREKAPKRAEKGGYKKSFVDKSNVICFKCNGLGHFSSDWLQKSKEGQSMPEARS